jgi:hypothetical protein
VVRTHDLRFYSSQNSKHMFYATVNEDLCDE